MSDTEVRNQQLSRTSKAARDLTAKSEKYALVSIDVSNFPLNDAGYVFPDAAGARRLGEPRLAAVLSGNCTVLHDLTLVNTGVSNWTSIGNALLHCPALQSIRISCDPVTVRLRSVAYDDTFDAVCLGIISSGNILTDINFSNCVLEQRTDFLALQMPFYWALTKLDLSGNGLRDHCDIIAALSRCSRLQHVDLSCNQLGLNAARALAIALPACTSLIHLDLSCNRFTSYDSDSLGLSVRLCTALRHLSLRKNIWIGARGLQYISQDGGLSRLTHLDVSCCGIRFNDCVRLANRFDYTRDRGM